MSDNIDDFMKKNRDAFDQAKPRSEVWNNINQGLNNAAAGAGSGSAATGTAAKGGLAKIATAWKIIGAIVATSITATGIYFAVGSSGTDVKGDAPTAVTETKKVELIEEDSPLVTPPIEGVTVPFNPFAVDAERGGKLTLPTGTVLTVPENAFVDQNGQPVKGEVVLNYREYHDGADLLLSGIPMKYEDNGKVYDFQTAGMMEITGSQGESPVFIAQGKEIEVSMGSYTEEDNYNLYFLDPEEKKWEDIGKAKLGKNKAKEEGLRLLRKKDKKPGKPVHASESQNTFDFAVDYKTFPELKPFKKIVWEPAGVADLNNDWIYNETWNNVKLDEKSRIEGIYTLTLTNAKTTFTLDVKPALDGKDYDKAMAKFQKKMDDYDNLRAQIVLEEDRLNAQADVMRTFSVARFGIYNCDRYYSMVDAVKIAAKFDFDKDVFVKQSNYSVFHITGENRTCIPYNLNTMNSFTYSPSEENYLVAVLPGRKVAVFGKNDFKKMDMKRVKARGKYTFKMRTIDKTVNDANDLRSILGV